METGVSRNKWIHVNLVSLILVSLLRFLLGEKKKKIRRGLTIQKLKLSNKKIKIRMLVTANKLSIPFLLPGRYITLLKQHVNQE